MMASELVAFLRHLKMSLFSPAKTREEVEWWKTAQIPWVVLHSGCHYTCKCAFQGIAKKDYDSCLASLPIPIWQVRLRPSGGHASVFRGLGLDAKRPRVTFDQNCLSHMKSSCFCQSWQALSLREAFPPAASPATFANPLPTGGKSTHPHGRKATDFLVSWGWGRWGARRVNTEQLLGRSYHFKGQNYIPDWWVGLRSTGADFVACTI